MPIVISIVSSASRWGGKIPGATRWPGSHGTKVPSGTARYTWNGDIILQANACPDWCTGHALYRLVRQPVLAISWWSRIGCTHACLRLCFFCEFKQCAHQCVLLDVANACHGCVCKQLTATAKHVGHCSAPYVFAFALSCLQTHSWHTHSTSHKIIETHMCKTRKINICRGIGTDKNHMLLEIRYGECVPPRLRLTCGGLFKYMFFDGILARQHRCLLAHVLFCVFPRVVEIGRAHV